jgi:hypothetical protein
MRYGIFSSGHFEGQMVEFDRFKLVPFQLVPANTKAGGASFGPTITPSKISPKQIGTALAEPLAAVRKPPTENQDRDGGGHGPPKWQEKVRQETNPGKSHPEDLALHRKSLTQIQCENANASQLSAKCDRRGPVAKRG